MKQSHQDNQISQPQPVRREFAVSPDNPTLFMTDAEIRARLEFIHDRQLIKQDQTQADLTLIDGDFDSIDFLLSLIAARLPALVPDRSEP